MCLGGSSPAPVIPPKLPEAPVAPMISREKGKDILQRQRAAGATLLTGGQGVTGNVNTEQKTLLGQ